MFLDWLISWAQLGSASAPRGVSEAPPAFHWELCWDPNIQESLSPINTSFIWVSPYRGAQLKLLYGIVCGFQECKLHGASAYHTCPSSCLLISHWPKQVFWPRVVVRLREYGEFTEGHHCNGWSHRIKRLNVKDKYKPPYSCTML